MNTLAKVLRSAPTGTAAGILAFKPDELGSSQSPSAGSQVFAFPVLDVSGASGGRSSSSNIVNTGHAAHSHTFPALDALPPPSTLPAFSENENTALEKALREKTLQETRAAVEAEVNAQIGSLRENLADTIARISEIGNEISAELEPQLVELALEIAKKVVAREVSTDREVVVSVTKNALSKLHSRTLASIHLHPDDLAYIQEHRTKLNFHGSLELIEDTSITPGGCLIHTDAGDIDGRIESQFDEIVNGLIGDSAD